MGCCTEAVANTLADAVNELDAGGHFDLARRFDAAIMAGATTLVADIVTDMEFLAAKGKPDTHSTPMPESWARWILGLAHRIDAAMRTADWNDPETRKKMWDSLGGSGEHKRTHCMEKVKGHVDDPAAYCQSLYSEFEK